MTGQQGTAKIPPHQLFRGCKAGLGPRRQYPQAVNWCGANCAVIVAHPDDETLWAGGTMLMNPQAQWKVITLCRKTDPDRAPKFFQALQQLNATGQMGDLDDGPEQTPLDSDLLRETILELLAPDEFDLIITHSPGGEYTRHRRHEETSKAVLTLWETGRLRASQIWQFAYEDGGGKYRPRPIQNADLKKKLPEKIWQKKYYIITNVYGFTADSFEARATPREEAFWCFQRPVTRGSSLKNRSMKNEGAGSL